MTVPARPCLDCGTPCRGSRCPTHQATRQHAKDARRPTRRSHHETQRRRAAVATHRAAHGDWCPGWMRPRHPSADLTADHAVPVAVATARGVHAADAEAGLLLVLCRPCNSARGATGLQ